jgi:ATP-dependent helicase HrpB
MPLLRRKGASVPAPHEVRDALIQSFDWPVQEALRQHAPLTLDLPSGQEARVDWLDPARPSSRPARRPSTASPSIRASPPAACR